MHKRWRMWKWFAILFVAAMVLQGENVSGMTVETTVCNESGDVGDEKDRNTIYDRLKDRLEKDFDNGLEQIGGADPIEITGNLPERMLRGVANLFARNLRSIKAGSLIMGIISFVMGAVLALLVRKDKKIRKRAIGIGMIAIPVLLLIVVFGVSGYVSIFK